MIYFTKDIVGASQIKLCIYNINTVDCDRIHERSAKSLSRIRDRNSLVSPAITTLHLKLVISINLIDSNYSYSQHRILGVRRESVPLFLGISSKSLLESQRSLQDHERGRLE